MARLSKVDRDALEKAAAAQAATRAASIFGVQESVFSGRAKVTTLGLQRGVSEMIRRIYATVPGVAPMSAAQPQIKTTYIGDQACARYTWARDKMQRLSVAGVINLPACGEHDALIPRRIADQYTGYSLHELSHFLFTPLNAFGHAIQEIARRHSVSQDFAKSIVNGLEDVAIERELIRSGYAPGAGAMLRGLVEKCIAEVPPNVYGTIRAFPVTLCFGLRGYTPAAQPLVDALPFELRTIYNAARDGLAALPPRAIGDFDCMQGLIDVADKVVGALAALRESQPQPGDNPQPGDGDGENGAEDGESGDSSGFGDGDGAEDGDAEDGDAAGDSEDGDGDGMGTADDTSKPGERLPPTPAQPDGMTPDAEDEQPAADKKPERKPGEYTPTQDDGTAEDKGPPPLDMGSLNGKPLSGDMQPTQAGVPGDGASGLANDNVTIRTAAEMGGIEAQQIAEDVTQALSTSARIAHALRTLLDTSARDSREGGRKNGRLDMGALSRIAVGAESVFEKRAYRDGTDAAVSILIDCSSSMNSGARYRAARTLAGALSKIISGCAGVRCEILGFHSGGGGSRSGSLTESLVSDVGTMDDQDLMRSLSGSCTVKIFKGFAESHAKAMSRLASCYGTGGTPDAASIICAAERLKKENAEQKILIVIADGEGSPESVLGRIVQRYTREGLMLIAVGIDREMNAAFPFRARVDDVRKLNESGLGALLHALAQGATAKAIAAGND